jgi:hypothetical protein
MAEASDITRSPTTCDCPACQLSSKYPCHQAEFHSSTHFRHSGGSWHFILLQDIAQPVFAAAWPEFGVGGQQFPA